MEQLSIRKIDVLIIGRGSPAVLTARVFFVLGKASFSQYDFDIPPLLRGVSLSINRCECQILRYS